MLVAYRLMQSVAMHLRRSVANVACRKCSKQINLSINIATLRYDRVSAFCHRLFLPRSVAKFEHKFAAYCCFATLATLRIFTAFTSLYKRLQTCSNGCYTLLHIARGMEVSCG
jgi:hypothetical protein